MKAFRLLSVFSLFAGGLLLAARADSPATVDRPALQVRVEAPYVVDLIHRDDIVDALFWRVRDGIRAKDRTLEVEQVEGDETPKGTPVLTLTLIHWRTNRMGDVECRFTAEYHSPDGKQSLGAFEGTTSAIVRSRGFASQDFERAAEQAGRDLAAELRQHKLI